MADGHILGLIEQAEKQLVLAERTIESNWAAYVHAPVDLARDRLEQAALFLAEAKELYEAGKDSSRGAALQAANLALDSWLLALPSRVAEARGVWYRPTERDYADVCRTLDRMQEAGFNELYLETWFWGYTIYPSTVAAKHGIENQHPAFSGWDPLHAFVHEARKRGIALHAWLDGFMVGINPTGGPILRVYPEWGALSRSQSGADKPQPQSGTGYFWLDVINPDVQNYFLAILVEMITRYEVAGVNLDFMRLPHAEDRNWLESYSFTSYARLSFEKEHGVDPLNIQPEAQPEIVKIWAAWLENSEDEFVSEMYRVLKSVRPDVIVSATPEPGAESEKIGQWSRCVDVVIPQAYYSSAAEVRASFEQHETQLEPGNLVYTGIYPMYAGMGAHETIDQVLAARDLDEGTVIFAFGQASSEVIRALRLGPWRRKAISPGLYPHHAIRALLASVKADVEQVYIPRQGMSETAAVEIIRRMNELISLADFADASTSGLWRVQLTELDRWVGEQNAADVHPAVFKQIANALLQLDGIMAYRQEKQIPEAKEVPYQSQP